MPSLENVIPLRNLDKLFLRTFQRKFRGKIFFRFRDITKNIFAVFFPKIFGSQISEKVTQNGLPKVVESPVGYPRSQHSFRLPPEFCLSSPRLRSIQGSTIPHSLGFLSDSIPGYNTTSIYLSIYGFARH